MKSIQYSLFKTQFINSKQAQNCPSNYYTYLTDLMENENVHYLIYLSN